MASVLLLVRVSPRALRMVLAGSCSLNLGSRVDGALAIRAILSLPMLRYALDLSSSLASPLSMAESESEGSALNEYNIC